MAKHTIQITTILITMFIITQIIGLFVVDFYNNPDNKIPFGMEPDDSVRELAEENPYAMIIQILIAFIIAVFLFFLLTRINAEKFIRLWFFVVTTIALGLTLNVILFKINIISNTAIIALILALPLAYFKIFKRDLLVHNISELMIYPGIAAVFVPILGILGIIIVLIVISIYDMWAVWRSKFMQKMAKYQINNLKFFAGFFIPYAGKKTRSKIKLIKQKFKNKNSKQIEKELKKSKVKVSVAILGGGDVIFPIITAGVFYKIMGLFPALIITASATIGLLGLFILARKGKFYPAMPFLTVAMFIGMLINWLVF